ncbi:aminotransferase class V [Pirellula staleyi DSM 6068]|uniref:Aminotransferase class V n=1 Tax=Pirellula staleyi (strain ATCC 27377 / DSM 6068 / ICPB 4128) TaxID=530564 RepID=D2R057_PIRSD|nr:aminotransferase class V-fold PLP-dependent enzyme [Pirellula staleyi]ADB18422.1 aminotransferase class V [Pirellula staleyi DSM 6068]
MQSTSSRWLSTLRLGMPVCQHKVYFDHAAVAPLPEITRKAIAQWLDEAATIGDVAWPRWASAAEKTRQLAAQVIGADTSEIALVPNTTTGIGLIAEGIDWRPGDNVVSFAGEFPSNKFPWMNLSARGVELRTVPLESGAAHADRLASYCDNRTRLVTASWVGYATGWRIDVEAVARFCQSHGILFFLDAIQGLGVFPLDMHQCPIDFLAADGHKWLLGPEGAGVLYVRKSNLAKLRPLGVGWNSVVASHDFSHSTLNLKPAAARYEGGSLNLAGFIGLGASLQFLVDAGLTPSVSPLADQIVALGDYAAGRLRELGATFLAPRTAGHTSGILTFLLPSLDPAQVRLKLLDAQIVTSCRGGGIRISPHAYNTTEEIDTLLEQIRSLLA